MACFTGNNSVLVVLTLMAPKAARVQPRTLEARRWYRPRDRCWRTEETVAPDTRGFKQGGRGGD